jgi:hypothetical protein
MFPIETVQDGWVAGLPMLGVKFICRAPDGSNSTPPTVSLAIVISSESPSREIPIRRFDAMLVFKQVQQRSAVRDRGCWIEIPHVEGSSVLAGCRT